jgi:hypothetical protein
MHKDCWATREGGINIFCEYKAQHKDVFSIEQVAAESGGSRTVSRAANTDDTTSDVRKASFIINLEI